MLNKTICMCWFVLCLISLMGCNAYAQGDVNPENNGLLLSNGFAYRVENRAAIIQEYVGHERHCTIPEMLDGYTVVGIEAQAFENKRLLKSVSMPDTVEWIGKDAFAYCDLLCGIDWSENIQSVGPGAFSGCYSLRNVTLPEGLTTIPTDMFYLCTGLRKVNCPDNLRVIGDQAFMGCYRLREISLSDSLETIGAEAFKECKSLRSIRLPDGVTEIKKETFWQCLRLKTVQLPAQLKAIEENAFVQCWSLESVRIPDSVEFIGAGAFNGCKSSMYLIGTTGSAAQKYCMDVSEGVAFQDADSGEVTTIAHPILHDIFFFANLYLGLIITFPIRLYGDLLHLIVRVY